MFQITTFFVPIFDEILDTGSIRVSDIKFEAFLCFFKSVSICPFITTTIWLKSQLLKSLPMDISIRNFLIIVNISFFIFHFIERSSFPTEEEKYKEKSWRKKEIKENKKKLKETKPKVPLKKKIIAFEK